MHGQPYRVARMIWLRTAPHAIVLFIVLRLQMSAMGLMNSPSMVSEIQTGSPYRLSGLGQLQLSLDISD